MGILGEEPQDLKGAFWRVYPSGKITELVVVAFECLNDNDRSLPHIEKVFPRLSSLLSDAFSWQKWVFFNPTREVIFVRIE
jgi:hypothetical protein